jgi:hypothetical protein
MIDNDNIEDEKVIENNNNQPKTTMFLLDKLEAMKSKKMNSELNISFIKPSSDESINSFIQIYFHYLSTGIVNMEYHEKEDKIRNIGLRKLTKIIVDPNNEEAIHKLNFHDYNYLMSKKFKYLRTEAIFFADVIIILINIFDKRGVENIKTLVEEVHTSLNNLNNSSSSNKKKKLLALLLKNTNNFLEKLREGQILNNVKKELSNANITNYIELEEDYSNDLDSLTMSLL